MNDERRKKLDTLLSKRDTKVEVSRCTQEDILRAVITNMDGTKKLGVGYGSTTDEAVSDAMLRGEENGMICIEPVEAAEPAVVDYEMLSKRGWSRYLKECIDLPGVIYRAERNVVTAGGFSGVVTICREESGAWYAYWGNSHTADEVSAYDVLQAIDFLTGAEGEWTRMKLREDGNGD